MIHVKNINKSYGNKPILTDVNVEFPTGQVTSLIGPNGAGKSTLLMMMARLIEPDKGEIFLIIKILRILKPLFTRSMSRLYVKHPALICA